MRSKCLSLPTPKPTDWLTITSTTNSCPRIGVLDLRSTAFRFLTLLLNRECVRRTHGQRAGSIRCADTYHSRTWLVAVRDCDLRLHLRRGGRDVGHRNGGIGGSERTMIASWIPVAVTWKACGIHEQHRGCIR